MVDLRKVTEDFSVSGQIESEDLEAVKQAGFQTILCNRPDFEDPVSQPRCAELQDQAEKIGLSFLALPFSGAPTDEIIAQQGALIEAAAKPVLAFCRTGTRSISAWALSEAKQGRGEAAFEKALAAGYDISGLKKRL